MALVEIKTKVTDSSVADFLNALDDAQKREDSHVLLRMMQHATGETPKMWGGSIIGFGDLIAKSPATGREVKWFKMGFSPRKAALSIYLCNDLQRLSAHLKKLGKHKTGAGCLYVKRLSDIDMKVLEKMVEESQ